MDVKFNYIGEHLLSKKTIPREEFIKLKHLSNVDWSYLAALFDGEGTLSIWRSTSKGKAGKPYSSTGCRISIYNTNETLMRSLISDFGGVYYSKRMRSKLHKPEFDWRPKGRKNIENILLGILPYLRIKIEQAKILLEYVRLPHNTGFVPELAAKRQELMQLVQKLNKRGLPVETNTLNTLEDEVMIESDLVGDYKSDPMVTLEPIKA